MVPSVDPDLKRNTFPKVNVEVQKPVYIPRSLKDKKDSQNYST